MTNWIVALVLAYAIGGVPFGLLLGFVRGVDIREHGSGNIGATNTMRVLGKRLGLLAFLLDVLKGAVPVLVWGFIISAASRPDLPAGEAFKWLGIGVATVLGHIFPIYLRFKGGKGVATGFGIISRPTSRTGPRMPRSTRTTQKRSSRICIRVRPRIFGHWCRTEKSRCAQGWRGC